MGDNMDKSTSSHVLNLVNRKSISLTGIKKIDNFSETEFILESIMGYMKIRGNNLEMIKLDTNTGDVSIKGEIDSIIYIDKNKKVIKESIMDKLFK